MQDTNYETRVSNPLFVSSLLQSNKPKEIGSGCNGTVHKVIFNDEVLAIQHPKHGTMEMDKVFKIASACLAWSRIQPGRKVVHTSMSIII